LLFRIDEIWHFHLILTVSSANWHDLFGSWTLSYELHSCSYTGTLLDWLRWPRRCTYNVLYIHSQHRNWCDSRWPICTHPTLHRADQEQNLTDLHGTSAFGHNPSTSFTPRILQPQHKESWLTGAIACRYLLAKNGKIKNAERGRKSEPYWKMGSSKLPESTHRYSICLALGSCPGTPGEIVQ